MPNVALFIVATPIGNLEDISFRAIDTLKSVSKIFAEDTRYTGILLKYYKIKTPLDSYNDINKNKKSLSILNLLEQELSLALVCDAGTPGIADPAFYVVREARRQGYSVISIPGPCAAISGLVSSGLPTDRFLFANFPPKKSVQQIKQLEYYRDLYQNDSQKWIPTLIYYVGKYQVILFLNSLKMVFGEGFLIVLARELTKKFEENLVKTIQEHLDYYQERKPKGEYVLLMHPKEEKNE